MKIMHNLHEIIYIRVDVYVIRIPYINLLMRGTGKFVTLLQRISILYISYFHNSRNTIQMIELYLF